MNSEYILLALAVSTLVLLAAWQLKTDAFDLRHIIVDSKTNRVSLFKVGQVTALIVSSWGFATLVQQNHITEWYFTGYMITWAGANLAKKFIDTKSKEDK